MNEQVTSIFMLVKSAALAPLDLLEVDAAGAEEVEVVGKGMGVPMVMVLEI
jgi:hypothetical protein